MAVTPYTIDSPMGGYHYGVKQLRNGITIDIPATHPQVFDPSVLESNWNDLDVYDIDTVQKFPLGTVLKQNRRVWMYASFAGTVTVGDMVGLRLTMMATTHWRLWLQMLVLLNLRYPLQVQAQTLRSMSLLVVTLRLRRMELQGTHMRSWQTTFWI